MTKQEVLDQVGREVQDTSAAFLPILSKAFDWVVMELAQRGCIGALRQKTTFQLVDGQMAYSTRTITGLSAPHYPSEIKRLLVPAWGEEGRLYRVSDSEFEDQLLAIGLINKARPRWWRLYPNDTTLEVFPVPDATNSGASCPVTIEFSVPPTTLADGADITEIRFEDIPTVKAGLYVAGVKFRDETYQDRTEAIAKFEQGVNNMKVRLWNQKYGGRDLRSKPRVFSL